MSRYRVNAKIRKAVTEMLGIYFTRCPVSFENVRDPETGRTCTWAYVNIPASQDVEAVLAQLSRFDTDWWLEKSDEWECQGRLQIDVRFMDSTL